MDVEEEKYIFYGCIPRGYNFKGVMDSMSVPIKRGMFVITRDGMSHCDTGEQPGLQPTILYTFLFPRTSFGSSYSCREGGFSFKCSLVHLTKVLKSVKKKDYLIIEILKADPTSMNLIIGSANASGLSAKETHVIKIQEAQEGPGINEPPPNNFSTGSVDISSYHQPITVKSTDFLKTKKIHTLGGKTVAMTMQRDKYLSISAGVGELYSSKVEFGEMCDKLPVDKEIEGVEGANLDLHTSTYGASTISMLVKLVALCKIAHFYQPKLACFPLKICVDIPELGIVTIYTLSNEQIEDNLSKTLEE